MKQLIIAMFLFVGLGVSAQTTDWVDKAQGKLDFQMNNAATSLIDIDGTIAEYQLPTSNLGELSEEYLLNIENFLDAEGQSNTSIVSIYQYILNNHE